MKVKKFNEMNENVINNKDRGFYYYPEENTIMFGVYLDNGDDGCIGELKMIWKDVHGITPQLRCYGDGFKVLASFNDVIGLLGDEDETLTEDGFIDILFSCGFKELTRY